MELKLGNLPKKSIQFGRNVDLPDMLIRKDTIVFKNLIGWPVCGRVCCLLYFLLAFLSKLLWRYEIVVTRACGYWNFLAGLKKFFERLIL